MVQTIFFSLAHHIYAAECQNSVIILDVARSEYISLIDSAAHYFMLIVEASFLYDDVQNSYYTPMTDNLEYQKWIALFLERKYIQICSDHCFRKKINQAHNQSIIENYVWQNKIATNQHKNVSYATIFQAIVTLARVQWQLRIRGMQGILQTIQNIKISSKTTPSQNEIDELEMAIDRAIWFYPQIIRCLPRAAVFVILARKKGWNSQLVIGIKSLPFYAHAWAEIDGVIIHDDPLIAKILTVILRTDER